jgi:hypothetical protein
MSPEETPPYTAPTSPEPPREEPMSCAAGETPAPERYPFWNYLDIVLFLGMALPSILAAGLVVKIVFLVPGLRAAPQVVELLAAQFMVYALLFGFLLAIFRVRYDKPFWRSLAWTPPRIPFLWIVIAGFVTGILVVVASNLIHTPDTPNPMTELMEGRASLIAMAIFGVTVAPLCEELGFRGFLQPLLVKSLGAAPGILLTAIPFGLLHWQEYGNSWRHVVVIAGAGAAFGWMRQATGSTRAAVLMHASYNALFFAALLRKDLPHGW